MYWIGAIPVVPRTTEYRRFAERIMARTIKTYPMNNSAIIRVNSDRDRIDTSPEYQRNSEVWTLEKKQLLIDSILNEYDIPKLYFHILPSNQKSQYLYAIIDGRQRIETIWAFIDNKFPLAQDFEYLKDANVKLSNLTYSDLAQKYPRIKIIFDGFSIPIILVDTDDIDLIDDMFSRLNEAVPLNAAEKRNAMGGPMVIVIREVSSHPFFKEKAKFSNKRYQYREVAAHLLYIEDALIEHGRYFDTKKPYIDAMVKRYKLHRLDTSVVHNKVTNLLNVLHGIFVDEDDLLRSQSIVPIYYLFIKEMVEQNAINSVTRDRLWAFKSAVEQNRKIAETDITAADFDLLEFDRMAQQGTNDASSIKERVRILKYFFAP
jgi:hypothetical protein